MKVLKFGGTSVKDKAAIDKIAAIIDADIGKKLIVVSAIAGVTNHLEKICELLEHKDIFNAIEVVELILKIHLVYIQDLGIGDDVNLYIQSEIEELRNYIKGVEYLGEFNSRIKDKIIAKGEILSSFVIYAYLNKLGLNIYHVDPRKFLKTDSNYGNAAPDYFLTNLIMKRVCAVAFETNEVILTGGFVGSDKNDETTTLGRGGSDYSAAIFARALNAKSLDIYSDVRGIMTADPRITNTAKLIDELAYSEALELSYLGAKVLHRRTILPVAALNIPINALSAGEAFSQGTLINNAILIGKPKAVTSKDCVILNLVFRDNSIVEEVRIEINRQLNEFNANVVLMNYSEIDFTIVIENNIKLSELLSKLNQLVDVKTELNATLISLVGEGLNTNPEIIAKFYLALKVSRIKFKNICISNRKLCISVDKSEVEVVIKKLHDEFF